MKRVLPQNVLEVFTDETVEVTDDLSDDKVVEVTDDLTTKSPKVPVSGSLDGVSILHSLLPLCCLILQCLKRQKVLNRQNDLKKQLKKFRNQLMSQDFFN